MSSFVWPCRGTLASQSRFSVPHLNRDNDGLVDGSTRRPGAGEAGRFPPADAWSRPALTGWPASGARPWRPLPCFWGTTSKGR
jgi:hypothetical protein